MPPLRKVRQQIAERHDGQRSVAVVRVDVDAVHADGGESLDGLGDGVVLADLDERHHIAHRLLADVAHVVLHGQQDGVKVLQQALHVLDREVARSAGAVAGEEADGGEAMLGHQHEGVDGAGRRRDEQHGTSADVGSLDGLLRLGAELGDVLGEERNDSGLREDLHDLAIGTDASNTVELLGGEQRDEILQSSRLCRC